jgi:hypothetical protein
MTPDTWTEREWAIYNLGCRLVLIFCLGIAAALISGVLE